MAVGGERDEADAGADDAAGNRRGTRRASSSRSEFTATPATWHEVSQLVGAKGGFDLKLAAPEGWYVTAPGSDQELLIPRQGYAAPTVTIPAVLAAIPALAADSPADLAAGYNMPKGVYTALFKDEGYIRGILTDDKPDPGPIGKALAGGTKVFKTALFLRPTMVVNIAVRGLIQAVGQEGPELFAPSTIADAWQMARDGDATITAGFKTLSTDQTQGFLGGSTFGRILKSIPDAMTRVTNLVTGVQRAMVFITEHDNMVDAGADEATARMAGMQAIRDTFVTADSMTPVEQAVIRQIFPFYAYEKMLFNYLATFPAEHPFITEVLSKVGEQETTLNKSGLPQQIQSMFFIGNPDPQTGNVSAVNVSGFDPFKSFTNDFTLAGLASQLNPALKLVLGGLGITPGTGTPELYPTLTVDPTTGGLVAKSPGVSLTGALAAAVPQLDTVNDMLGFNSRLKALKVEDPSAYRAELFQTLGIPIPQTVNVPEETAYHEQSLYNTSQTAVSNYIRTGDAAYITGYNLLPYQSRWWTPDQLQQWRSAQSSTIAAAKQDPTGTSIKALLQPMPRTTAQLPPTEQQQ